MKVKMCFVVERPPTKKDMKYGKRINWIDQHSFMPLKVDYWDNGGDSGKLAHRVAKKYSVLVLRRE